MRFHGERSVGVAGAATVGVEAAAPRNAGGDAMDWHRTGGDRGVRLCASGNGAMDEVSAAFRRGGCVFGLGDLGQRTQLAAGNGLSGGERRGIDFNVAYSRAGCDRHDSGVVLVAVGSDGGAIGCGDLHGARAPRCEGGAARKGGTDETSRGPAIFFSALLGVAGIAATAASDFWVGAALLLAAAGYAAELARQRSAAALRMPLTTVGVQMLTMSLVYSAMVVRGLW
jgi:hypothetical protein